MRYFLALLLPLLAITACGQKTGSESWCDTVEAKPQNELTDGEKKDWLNNCTEQELEDLTDELPQPG